MGNRNYRTKIASDRGTILYIVAAAMVAMIAFVALAVDLGHLYSARADCQKIADAAALAGAREAFLVPNSNPTTAAQDAAKSAATANYTPESPSDRRLVDANINVDSTARTVRVTVTRTASNRNPVKMFFATIFGMAAVDVAATAKAEVYVPPEGSDNVGRKCLKPLLLSKTALDTLGRRNGEFTMELETTGLPNRVPLVGANLEAGSLTPSCPSCEAELGGLLGGLLGDFSRNLVCCNKNTYTCGRSVATLDLTSGAANLVNSLVCLITHTASTVLEGTTGQDVLLHPSVTGDRLPLTIITGDSNPLGAGLRVTDSDSLMTVGLYDGSPPPPGGNVTITGFMQIFIKDVKTLPAVTIDAYIIRVLDCAGSAITSGGPTGSPLPVRLVRDEDSTT